MTDRSRKRRADDATSERLPLLRALERKVLWLACWMIHNANHLRPSRDGLKVGGHQASCASVATIMAALYLDVLRPGDRVAVKPHASPILHAIEYLFGNRPRDELERFRGLGGAQSYPSRTKDSGRVDFSTGSVGLGVAQTLFASLVQDLVRFRGLVPDDAPPGRMIGVMGDAELDEGNVFEALLEGWKYDVRNLWWIIDYNRQSLDRVVPERLFAEIEQFFAAVGWQVVTVKYGKRLQAAFRRPGGRALRKWIDDCPNDLYAALTFKGGAGWRAALEAEIGQEPGIRRLLASHDDAALAALMTNLGGHDIESVLDAFHAVTDDRPHCFIMYTIKGFGLPFAGHKDNHAGLMTVEQMERFRRAHEVPEGSEWEPFAGMAGEASALRELLDEVPFANRHWRKDAPRVQVPSALPDGGYRPHTSTQDAFGRIMAGLARSEDEIAERIVTTLPDVTVSTSLGGWVSRRGVFNRRDHADVFRDQQLQSAYRWAESRTGQHMELGIAENNLFLNLAALGLSHALFGARLLPVGTLYDPFIHRGLDALTYACYQDARFLLVATPSGITLAPEGGAHQSIATPLVGIGHPGLTYFEPAFADEIAIVMRWAFEHMQADDGGSVYLRLSTRVVDQPERSLDDAMTADLLDGAYWLAPPSSDADLIIAFTGAVAPEAIAAHEAIREDIPGAGLLAVASPDRLHAAWRSGGSEHLRRVVGEVGPGARIVTVLDGHPATLSWIGAVRGHRIKALGTDRFGQSGDIPDLYRVHRIDTDAIIEACAAALLDA